MQVDLKTDSLEALFDAYHRDKDIIQQTLFNKPDETSGKEITGNHFTSSARIL
jgi:hypothetical protein